MTEELKETNIIEDEQFEELLNEMFEAFMEDGFDFNSGMTFDEVFKQVFSAGVNMAIEVMENSEEGE